MGKKKQTTAVIDQPSMTTIVTKEYLIPPFTEVVIHKRFFKYWTLLLLVSVYVGTRVFNFDLWLLWWHMANWWALAIEGAILALTLGVLWLRGHPVGKHKPDKNRMARYDEYLSCLTQGWTPEQLRNQFPEFTDAR